MNERETNNSTDMLAMLMSKGSLIPESLEDRVNDSKEEICNTIRDSKIICDHYGNSLTSIGTDDKVETFTKYGFSNDTLNYPLWLALYNDSWVFRRAIDKPAQDEIKCGVRLEGTVDKSAVYKYIKKSRFDMIQLLQWGALFGGSVAIMMFDNMKDEDYASKMDWNKIKKAKVIRYYVTDRWYGVSPSSETVTDMANIDFGKPKSYTVYFPDGKSLKVHHDFVLRYEHRVAPKLIKNGQLQGWGYAEGSHILNELSRDDQLKSSIQSLINKSLIEVIKMSGMRGVFMGTDKASEAQLKKRLEMVNWGRNFNSLTFLDKEDDYSMNNFSGLSGLSDILEKNMWMIAAALEMQGVLFGDLKSGFSNDTEALERYDETINGRCESYLRPIYDKLFKIFYVMCGIDEKVEYSFKSLLSKQQNETRMMNLATFVDLGVKLMDAGIINTKQLAKAFVNYSTKDEVNFDISDEDIDKLGDDFEQMSEGFDVSNFISNKIDKKDE